MSTGRIGYEKDQFGRYKLLILNYHTEGIEFSHLTKKGRKKEPFSEDYDKLISCADLDTGTI